jgi:hypothetical protein
LWTTRTGKTSSPLRWTNRLATRTHKLVHMASSRSHILLWLCLLQALSFSFTYSFAQSIFPSPISSSSSQLVSSSPMTILQTDPDSDNATFIRARDAVFSNSSGIPQVFDGSTHATIPQGPASDGSGESEKGSPAPFIWMAFCFLVGVPMALAGVRGWRFTVGAGIGLALSVSGTSFLPMFLLWCC